MVTGEEEERTEYQIQAKLFVMGPLPQGGWKERGVGILKLNVNKETGWDARLGVHPVCLIQVDIDTYTQFSIPMEFCAWSSTQTCSKA